MSYFSFTLESERNFSFFPPTTPIKIWEQELLHKAEITGSSDRDGGKRNAILGLVECAFIWRLLSNGNPRGLMLQARWQHSLGLVGLLTGQTRYA